MHQLCPLNIIAPPVAVGSTATTSTQADQQEEGNKEPDHGEDMVMDPLLHILAYRIAGKFGGQ